LARLRFSRLGSECRAGCGAADRQESTEALELPELSPAHLLAQRSIETGPKRARHLNVRLS